MRSQLVRILKKTPVYLPLLNISLKRRQKKELVEWERQGRPAPVPHILKQETLREYSVKYGLRTLVETGTFRGDMLEAMRNDFDVLYSIELSTELYEAAQKRFKGVEHIRLIQGDSGEEIEKVVTKLDGPALFWLDGHYSGGVTARGSRDTPILDEVNCIFGKEESKHVIIIDDARLFGTDPAYPSIDELRDNILSKRKNVDVVIENDSIRITPKD